MLGCDIIKVEKCYYNAVNLPFSFPFLSRFVVLSSCLDCSTLSTLRNSRGQAEVALSSRYATGLKI